ncbi:MAG TPA: hypothetical protein VJB57_19975 [Dehalococcoidia bacterium]|nr:hypothetical protein [Dehalococcoidia bacterium]
MNESEHRVRLSEKLTEAKLAEAVHSDLVAPRRPFALSRAAILILVVSVLAGVALATPLLPILIGVAILVASLARQLIWPKTPLTLNVRTRGDFNPPGILDADLDEATQEAALQRFDFDGTKTPTAPEAAPPQVKVPERQGDRTLETPRQSQRVEPPKRDEGRRYGWGGKRDS